MNLRRSLTSRIVNGLRPFARIRRRGAMAFLTVIFLLCPGVSQNQDNINTIDTQDVIQFLNRNIEWYRQLNVERQFETEPSDITTVQDNRRVADQTIRLAFDFARAEAQLLAAQRNTEQPEASPTERYQSLTQLAARLDQQAKQTQAEVEALRQKLATASRAARRDLESRIAETQSELDLVNARKDAIRTMLDFVSGASASGLGASGLRAQIEALARSVPTDVTKSANSDTSSNVSATPSSDNQAQSITPLPRPQVIGIWALASDLFALSSKVHALEARIDATDRLAKNGKDLRTPLIARLKQLSAQGDQLATAADSADNTALAEQKKQLDALTAQFKQTSAAVLPLSKQGVLLGIYKNSLTNWQSAVRERYRSELRSLAVRIIILTIILVLVLAFAEVWRRTIFRYIHDPRRRYQFLLLRRIVLWFAIAMVVAFAFATELGSIATFAGLLTAGVAVALQNVILSIAGYFFLIGRFGIRVGDRVQIAGVTGEVVEIGLVRIHMMEVGGDGTNAPTGRVVAFSNSIVFQPTSGLFKQVPGTHFVWHEIRLTLAHNSNYQLVEKRLFGAVEKVFAEYRDDMELQHRQLERTVSSNLTHGLKPRSWLHFTSTGLEAVIRYPVDLAHATEIDDRITRELLKAVEEEPRLSLVGAGGAAIKVTTDLTSQVSS